MKKQFVIVLVLLVSGIIAKPTGDKEKEEKGKEDKVKDEKGKEVKQKEEKGKEEKGKEGGEEEEEVPNQEHGPKLPHEELHGVLMHGDNATGGDHAHEHEQLLKKVPNQKHGPQAPHDDKLKASHVEHGEHHEHGPKDPMKDLHGVLMHGDTEHGIEHEEHVEEHPHGEIKVFAHETVGDGVTVQLDEEQMVQAGKIGTVDEEELVHGKHGVHKHSEGHQNQKEAAKSIGPFALDEDILHQIMHDGKIDSHTDEELRTAKKIGYEELQYLNLGDELLSQIDLKKLLNKNKQEYKNFQEHLHTTKDKTKKVKKDGDHKHWSLWEQVSQIKLQFGIGSDGGSTEDKDPHKAEWDNVVLRRSGGEDEVAFKMELAANSGPIYSRKKKVLHDEQ
ncbi:cilia- and flagella-associated protein 251-like [Gigantopelta aegis]|uniref:cilia- and flagella-associated protein 251-like n=1 Tax=Gigantopelta aegis TaxID=1735272 RepID=UPI001B88865B|nr:cilia- and flagella-associated protein 251-like [Gigantopelta aegis]